MVTYEVVDKDTGEVRAVPVVVRSALAYDVDAVSRETAFVPPKDELTLTQQQFKDDCDINVIVDRFGISGDMPQNVRVPLSEEFIETIDYRTAIDKIKEADDAFMSFPAKIRAQFENDPAKFVDFVSDPANVGQVREWGLANPLPQSPEPLSVRVIAEPAKQDGPVSS